MGIGDKGLVSVGNDIENVTFELIADAVDEDSEVISIYNGADVSEEDAQKLAGRVEERHIRTLMCSATMADSRYTII